MTHLNLTVCFDGVLKIILRLIFIYLHTNVQYPQLSHIYQINDFHLPIINRLNIVLWHGYDSLAKQLFL